MHACISAWTLTGYLATLGSIVSVCLIHWCSSHSYVNSTYIDGKLGSSVCYEKFSYFYTENNRHNCTEDANLCVMKTDTCDAFESMKPWGD